MIENWLYAPERIKWVKKPESNKNRGCVFCRIAQGKHKREESLVLHNDKGWMVIMNLYPYNTGHLQVMPVKHVKSIEELTDRQLAEFFVLVKKSVKMLKKALHPLGFNIGLNQGGTASGASFEHLHVHIVPRFKRDYGFIDIIGGTKVLPERVEDTYKRLKKHARMLE
jgi:diadenosine tetraphosphate (Ap4A) HIT family hydrolase